MMGPVLEVNRLCKEYPKFRLLDVSFKLERGTIMGLIGRNGAGKTTTLKAILGLVRPSAGEVRAFGLDFAENEWEIKQRLGYAGGAVDYYRRKKLRDIAAVTKTFYRRWDEDVFYKYLDRFSLDPDKTPAELSQGMKVKLSLALAMSHRAELLILDEPTSGLDPVSRAELIEIFHFLRRQNVAILFSTHITSDLEKCADCITYLREGEVVASETLVDFVVFRKQIGFGETLEDIMVTYEKEALREKLAE